MTTKIIPTSRITNFGFLGMLLACSSTACRLPGNTSASPATRSDILVGEYPELSSGRFAVIADFEDDAHMELVQFSGASAKGKCVLNDKKGRRETGRRCLQLTTGSADDVVIINNNNAVRWSLKRDWRPYDLLLMAVHSPRSGLSLDVVVGAGASTDRAAVETSLALEEGWNVVRLDVGEIGEHLAIDDIHELRLSVSGLQNPAEVLLDDVILTGNRQDLLGDSRARNGRLYVQRAGKRWNIGAGGRFELTFANGQIVQWFNLAADPYRLRNLVLGTTLGPSPVVVVSSDEPVADFGSLGEAVLTRPRILEMNEVRIVVSCEWRFVDDPMAPAKDRPFQRWVYTVYRTGQVYATVSCTAATPTWIPDQLGLAVTLVAGDNEHLETYTVSPTDSTALPGCPAYALARNRSTDTSLLFALADESPSARVIEQFDRDLQRMSFVAVTDPPDSTIKEWRCGILLGQTAKLPSEEAEDRAFDFANPGRLTLALGSVDGDEQESVDASGFDHRLGCYRLRPDQGRIRAVLDGREHPLFSPAFEITGVGGGEAWVYVNHLIFDDITEKAGNLLFQLPDTIRDETVVEVLVRRPANFDGA